MWTVNILKITNAVGQITLGVQYTDGGATLRDSIVIKGERSLEGVKAQIRQRLVELQRVDDLGKVLIEGQWDVTAPSPDPPTITPQIEQDFVAWMRLWARLKAAHQLVTVNVITAENPALIALQQETQTSFKDEFLNR